MNEVLNNIMKFVNENTYLLIGICIFLILVLIGYLIDNSIKSKRVRKDVKNENMAQEALNNSAVNNISIDKKDEIMTMPKNEENEDLIINSEIESSNMNISNSSNSDMIEESKKFVKEDDLLNEPINFEFDLNNLNVSKNDDKIVENNEDINKPDDLIKSNIIENVDDELKLVSPILVDEPIAKIKDPDEELMKNANKSEIYSNNKSLLEILSDVDKSKPVINDNKIDDNIKIKEIFNDKPEIEINKSIEKEKVDIESKYSPDEELDKIMKKLSEMNNEEDNYTNIF